MATDFATLALTWKPNQFLVLPAGYKAQAKPHAESPVFARSPDQVLDAALSILDDCRKTASRPSP